MLRSLVPPELAIFAQNEDMGMVLRRLLILSKYQLNEFVTRTNPYYAISSMKGRSRCLHAIDRYRQLRIIVVDIVKVPKRSLTNSRWSIHLYDLPRNQTTFP